VDAHALASAESVEAFAALVPHPSLQRAVQAVCDVFRSQPQAFFIEAALDQGYFLELLARTAALPDEDRHAVLPVVHQEVDAFHLALVTRGLFLYGLKPELLARFHVGGAGIRRARLEAMLAAGNLADVAAKAVGLAIDELPHELSSQGGLARAVDPSLLEVMARNRFLRLANRAFRSSPMGPGAVIGYTAIRRVELANLITLTEGIRVGLRPEAIRARLIPQAAPTASKTDAQVSHA
jgi:vacuolar-type H+-ATPase subunit C/Vma6